MKTPSRSRDRKQKERAEKGNVTIKTSDLQVRMERATREALEETDEGLDGGDSEEEEEDGNETSDGEENAQGILSEENEDEGEGRIIGYEGSEDGQDSDDDMGSSVDDVGDGREQHRTSNHSDRLPDHLFISAFTASQTRPNRPISTQKNLIKRKRRRHTRTKDIIVGYVFSIFP
jgi:hypothetical protein